MPNLKCPFCGKDDIEHGLLTCTGCQAKIKYSLVYDGMKLVVGGAFLLWLSMDSSVAVSILDFLREMDVSYSLRKKIHSVLSESYWIGAVGVALVSCGVFMMRNKAVNFELDGELKESL